jgi:hypothetical protein
MIEVRTKASERTEPRRTSAHVSWRQSVPLRMREGEGTIDTRSAAGNMAMQRLFCSGAIQAKLTISQPGDVFEREADEVAERVMQSAAAPSIQRKCATCAAGTPCPACEQGEMVQAKEASRRTPRIAAAAEAWIASLCGGGQPLPISVRAVFEPLFQRDFTRVRIHAGREASEAASSVQARAFTAGWNVAFAAGEYDPQGREGQRLLAHELTHVLQQDAENTARPISGNATGRESGPPPLSSPHTSALLPAGTIQRQAAKVQDVCGLREPLYGFDSIRNIRRSRLVAAGFTFCGPSDLMPSDPLGNYWERWVHPTQGVLHFQVHWKEEPPSEQKPGEEEPNEPDGIPEEETPSCATEATDEADWLEKWGIGLEVELGELWKMQRNKDPQIKPRLSDFYERMSQYDDKLDEAIARFPEWDENTDLTNPDCRDALDDAEGLILQLRKRFNETMVTPTGDF